MDMGSMLDALIEEVILGPIGGYAVCLMNGILYDDESYVTDLR